jgi:NADH dehydrogenase
MRVLVLGGAGFIGRHAVAALQARGEQLCIGSRHPGRALQRLRQSAPEAIAVETRFERLLHATDWLPLLEDCEAVINCVGILRQRRGETYDAVHVQAPAALAEACRLRGLRLVHVSALALEHPHRSGFLRSKREGERLLLASGADVCLVRPSLLDGEGGFGARWIRAFAQLPLHVLPRGATGRIAALDVRDLGEALAELVHRPIGEGEDRIFELGGAHALDIASYFQALHLRHAPREAVQRCVPDWLTRAASHAFDLLHFSPLSFGHWELLRKDNVPARNRLPELLGRSPRTVVGAEPTGAGSGSRPAYASLPISPPAP